jgi:hypothetical protein
MVMVTKKEKFDGRSRPANKAYDEGWNRIFKAGVVNNKVKVEDLTKILKDVDKDYDASEDLKKIEDRNGF